MTRVYKKTDASRVINSKPRKKPRWSNRWPVKAGWYWVRAREGRRRYSQAFLHYEPCDLNLDEKVSRTWQFWSARIKEPKP